MAIEWGPWEQFQTTADVRVGIEMTWSGSGSTVTVTADLWMDKRGSGNILDPDVKWTIASPGTGNTKGSGEFTYDTVSYDPRRKYASTSWSVTRGTGGTTVQGHARVRMKGRDWGWATQSLSIPGYTPPPPPDPPVAPSNLSVARVDDSKQTLTWSGGSYTSLRVERRSRAGSGGAWSSWQSWTVSGSSGTYTDTGTQAGYVYEYRLRAQNSGGTRYTDPVSIATSPLPPAAPTAARDGADVVVTRPVLAYGVTHWRAHRAYDGTWVTPPTAAIPASTATWTHVSPPVTQVHTYRIEAGIEQPDETVLWSGVGATSAPVTLVQPPNAPTNLRPSGGADATRPIVTSFQFNSVDTTPQSAVEWQWRYGTGSATSTGKIATTVPQREWPAGTWENGRELQWRVRAWGYHGDPSPWSDWAVLPLADAPTATINGPTDGTVWTSQTLTVTWSHYSPTGSPQSAWDVSVSTTTGEVLGSWSGTGGTDSLQVPLVLADGASYVVTVTTLDGRGIASDPDQVTVHVALAPPPVPTLTATWQEDTGSVLLVVSVPEAGPGEEEAVSATVLRAEGDDWVVVAQGLPTDGAATDRIPPVGGVVQYRALAVSALPSTTSSPVVPVTTTAPRLYINHGASFSSLVTLASNLTAQRSVTPDKVYHHFAGRRLPVEYAGEGLDLPWQVTASRWEPCIVPGMEDSQVDWADVVVTLAAAPAPVCLRGPHGLRVFVGVTGASESAVWETASTLTLSMVQVDHVERTWP